MKQDILRCKLAVAWATLLLLTVGEATAQKAKLTVRVDNPGARISPLLYGISFEEINRAGDGGLYAELIQNRSFEDATFPSGWTLVKSGGADGSMALDNSRPLNTNNPTSLRLEVTKTAGGRVGVANDGFNGMPFSLYPYKTGSDSMSADTETDLENGIAVQAGKQYVLSLYARCGNGFSGLLTASIEKPGGTVIASQQLGGIGTAWKKFECRLTAKATEAHARLVIATASAGTIWLDMISVFPKDTFKGRTNGLRPDLAQMLVDLKPAFLRFPGGCFVEGDELRNAYRWKKTIGDISERPGHWNLWGYRSTDGLGYHEYLQMSEDLGAEPLFCINAGLSHRDKVALDQMKPWVQDALDAIEYANGATNSVWGALRAKAGHPAPFNLKFVEIGNENYVPAYQERYALFYDAIKARYPDMILVANTATDLRPADLVDEHHYSTADFFISQASLFDTWPRFGPKICVGEYAVNEDCGQGNLRGAVAEAAFLTGLERNADVVLMASYAPLMANVNHRMWNPNLINFDRSRAYALPSYYVQKMFSENRGNVVLPVQGDVPPANGGTQAGTIGVGTWLTQAEFKDIRVTRGNETLYACDFAAGVNDWKLLGDGAWQAQDGVLRQTASGQNARAITGDSTWIDYTYSLKARKLGGAEGFLILFRLPDENAKSWWNLGGWDNSRHAVEMGGIVGDAVPGNIETGRWYDIRVVLKGNNIKCYLDGKLMHDVDSQVIQGLQTSASLVNASASSTSGSTKGSQMTLGQLTSAIGDVILKVANVSSDTLDTEIQLAGVSKVNGPVKATVLTSARPTDESSLDNPARITPVTKAIPVTGVSIRHSFPGNSVTVLRANVNYTWIDDGSAAFNNSTNLPAYLRQTFRANNPLTLGRPVLTCPASVGATQGQAFKFQTTVSGKVTRFSATGLPGGLTIHPTTGLIWGTPTNCGSFPVTVQAANTTGQDANLLTLAITSLSNHAPVLASIPTWITCAGLTFTLTNAATDDDYPPQTLTFSLVSAPTAASVQPDTGVLIWRPAGIQAGSTNLFRVRVTDNGSPSLSATQSFTVAVNRLAQPVLMLDASIEGQIRLQVSGDYGSDYSVQASDNLDDWQFIYTTNSPLLPFIWTDTSYSTCGRRFYRIRLSP